MKRAVKPKGKKKKEFNLEKDRLAVVFASLRKASVYWKPINDCKKNAKVGRLYRCVICNNLTDKPKIDHINPVVALEGFKDWDTYINNLFCDETNLQCLCDDCHKLKTKEENLIRKELKKKPK